MRVAGEKGSSEGDPPTECFRCRQKLERLALSISGQEAPASFLAHVDLTLAVRDSGFLPRHGLLRSSMNVIAPARYLRLPRPCQVRLWGSCIFRASSGIRLARLQGHKPSHIGHASARLIRTSRARHADLTTSHEQPAAAPPAYQAPRSGILSILPKAWVPYAELIRLDKPAGTYYLFFPCLFSTLMAAPMATPMALPAAAASTSVLFFSGALIMRGAGCSINDLWDRNLDPHVARTRLRPIARGAITPFQGLAFTGVQLFAGLGILLQFPLPCLFYGVPSLLLVASYPLAKRITYYPQFVLGLTFSWGAIMGFPALGIDLLSNSPALAAAACLYASNIAWTVLYDMIYAHMDIRDDAKAGIKSIALKHDAETKQVLTGLALVQVSLLAAAGVAAGSGPLFFIGSCGGALATLGLMIRRVKLKDPKDCWWWFVNGCWITGGVVATGMAADYVVRYRESKTPEDPGVSKNRPVT